jgi:hypothetical protein
MRATMGAVVRSIAVSRVTPPRRRQVKANAKHSSAGCAAPSLRFGPFGMTASRRRGMKANLTASAAMAAGRRHCFRYRSFRPPPCLRGGGE